MLAKEAIQDALTEINVVGVGDAAEAVGVPFAMRKLSRLLLAWQNLDYPVWRTSEQTLTLTTAASYTLNPVRPMRILSARRLKDGTETPMQSMTRSEYDDLPRKTSTGIPTTYYYDKQRADALFKVWPVLATADGTQVKITYIRGLDETDDVNTTLDIPPEWEAALVWGLAVELAPAYQRPAPVEAAAGHLDAALSADREDSVFFVEPDYSWAWRSGAWRW